VGNSERIVVEQRQTVQEQCAAVPDSDQRYDAGQAIPSAPPLLLLVLDELEAVGLGVALHEAHEPVPLPGRAHHVFGLDPRRLPVHELGAHVHRLQDALLVDHVEPRDVPQLRRRVEHRRLLEREDGHAVGAVPGLGQPHVRDRLLVRALDELDRWLLRHHHHPHRRAGAAAWPWSGGWPALQGHAVEGRVQTLLAA
jgi:hypothetical protein